MSRKLTLQNISFQPGLKNLTRPEKTQVLWALLSLLILKLPDQPALFAETAQGLDDKWPKAKGELLKNELQETSLEWMLVQSI